MPKSQDHTRIDDQYSIFRPKSKDSMLIEYPELAEYEEFRHLNHHEMLFVWYYACEASPISIIESKRDRVQKSMDESFFKANHSKALSEKEAEKYLSGNFPDKIADAIEIMRKFRIGPRVRGLMMLEKGYQNLQKIVCIDESDDIFTGGDIVKQKNYVAVVKDAVELMPKMIEQLERRHGVSEKKNNLSALEGLSLIDEFHEVD